MSQETHYRITVPCGGKGYIGSSFYVGMPTRDQLTRYPGYAKRFETLGEAIEFLGKSKLDWHGTKIERVTPVTKSDRYRWELKTVSGWVLMWAEAQDDVLRWIAAYADASELIGATLALSASSVEEMAEVIA